MDLKNTWNDIYTLTSLIIKRLAGLDIQEEVHRKWLNNHHIAKKVLVPGYITDRLSQSSTFDKDGAYAQFRRQRMSHNYLTRRWLKYAAAIFIAVASGIWLYFDQPPVVNNENFVSTIPPGQVKAFLRLSDGRQVAFNLTDTTSLKKQLKEQQGILLNTRNGLLDYTQTGAEMPTETLYNEIAVPHGAEFKVQLVDGTQVHLNAGSKLIYPITFAGNTRRVAVTGEAFFKVAPIATQPFVVTSGNLRTTVLGTTFNVKAYDDEVLQITVATGKVKVECTEIQHIKQNYIITSDQQVIYNGSGKFKKQEVNAGEFIAWTTGSYIFNEKPLAQIVKDLERWYDVSITFQDTTLGLLHFSGNLEKYEDLNDFLKILVSTDELTYKANGRKIILMRK